MSSEQDWGRVKLSRRKFFTLLLIIALPEFIDSDVAGRGNLVLEKYIYDPSLGMEVFGLGISEPLDIYVDPCGKLLRQIASEEGHNESVFQFFPKTAYGPLVNLALPDGKIRCYGLKDGSFSEISYFTDAEEEGVCQYNPEIERLEIYDPFNPDRVLAKIDP